MDDMAHGRHGGAGRGHAVPRWMVVASVCLIACVALFFCIQKRGFFSDEFYTYALANSTKGPSLGYVKEKGYDGSVYTRQDFIDLFSVQEGEQLIGFGYALVNQAADMHPPLYYLLVHAVSSLVPNTFSNWVGLGLNLVLYATSLLVLHRLARLVFRDEAMALLCTLLYGLSSAALSTMLLVRMYQLETLMTLALALELWRLRDEWSIRRCALVGLAVLGGLLSQYYFVFFAFLACLAFDVRLLARHELRRVAVFSLLALSGVALFLFVWPFVLEQLGRPDGNSSGMGALGRLLALSDYPRRLAFIGGELLRSLPVPLLLTAVGLSLLAVLAHRAAPTGASLPADEGPRLIDACLLFVVPALATVVIVAVIMPLWWLRYLYNVLPLLVLAPCCAWRLVAPLLVSPRHMRVGLLSLVGAAVALSLAALAVWGPDWLDEEYLRLEPTVRQHADAPCVVILGSKTESMTFSLTNNSELLLAFNDVCVVLDSHLDPIVDYLADKSNADKLVVFTCNDLSVAEMDVGQLVGNALVVAHAGSEVGFTRCRMLAHSAQTCLWLLSP